MTTRVKDKQYWKKHLFVLVLLSSPFAAGVYWGFRDRFGLSVPTMIFLFIYIGLAYIFWQWWHRRYKCPNCRTLIKGPTIASPEDGDPLNFYCENCDIEWETGFNVTYD